MGQTSIVTGQHVRIEQTAASMFQRGLAWGIDLFVMVGVEFVIITLCIAINAVTKSDTATITAAILLEVLLLSYPLLMEIFCHGQTLGKKICSTQVIRVDGTDPTLSDYMLRWTLLFIDFPYFLIGMVFIIFTKNSQRLGDLAAGTTVVKKHQYGDLYYDLRLFEYAEKNFKPTYPEAANLSEAQADVIQSTFWIENWNKRALFQERLASKVINMLSIDKGDLSDARFLKIIYSDYQYYNSKD